MDNKRKKNIQMNERKTCVVANEHGHRNKLPPIPSSFPHLPANETPFLSIHSAV